MAIEDISDPMDDDPVTLSRHRCAYNDLCPMDDTVAAQLADHIIHKLQDQIRDLEPDDAKPLEPDDAKPLDAFYLTKNDDGGGRVCQAIDDAFDIEDASKTHRWKVMTLDSGATYLCLVSRGVNDHWFLRSVFKHDTAIPLHLVRRHRITMVDDDPFTNKGITMVRAETEEIHTMPIRHKATLTLDADYMRVFVRDLVWGLYKYIDTKKMKFVFDTVSGKPSYSSFVTTFVSSIHGATGVMDDLVDMGVAEAGDDASKTLDTDTVPYDSGYSNLHPVLWEMAKLTVDVFNKQGPVSMPFSATNIFCYHHFDDIKTVLESGESADGVSFADAYVWWVNQDTHNDHGNTTEAGNKIRDSASGFRYHGEDTNAFTSILHVFPDVDDWFAGKHGEATTPIIKERVVFEITSQIMAVAGTSPVPLSYSCILANHADADADADADDTEARKQVLIGLKKKVKFHNTAIATALRQRGAVWDAKETNWRDKEDAAATTHAIVPSMNAVTGYGPVFTNDSTWATHKSKGLTVDEKVTMRLLFYHPAESTYWDADSDKFVLMKDAPITAVEEVFMASAASDSAVATAAGRGLLVHVPYEDPAATMQRANRGAYLWTTLDLSYDGYDDKSWVEDGRLNDQGQVAINDATCGLDCVSGVTAGPCMVMLRDSFACAGALLCTASGMMDVTPDDEATPRVVDTRLRERMGIAGRADICTYGIARGYGLFAYDHHMKPVFVEAFDRVNRARRSPLIALTGYLDDAESRGIRCWYNGDAQDRVLLRDLYQTPAPVTGRSRGGRTSSVHGLPRPRRDGAVAAGDGGGAGTSPGDDGAVQDPDTAEEEVWYFRIEDKHFYISPDAPKAEDAFSFYMTSENELSFAGIVNCNSQNLKKFIGTYGITARSFIQDGVDFAATIDNTGRPKDANNVTLVGAPGHEPALRTIPKVLVNVFASQYPVAAWESGKYSKDAGALKPTQKLSGELWAMLVYSWAFSAGTATFREHLYGMFGHELTDDDQDDEILSTVVGAFSSQSEYIGQLDIAKTRGGAARIMRIFLSGTRFVLSKLFVRRRNRILTKYFFNYDITIGTQRLSRFEYDLQGLRSVVAADSFLGKWLQAREFVFMQELASSLKSQHKTTSFIANLMHEFQGYESTIQNTLTHMFVRKEIVTTQEAGRLQISSLPSFRRVGGVRRSNGHLHMKIVQEFDDSSMLTKSWKYLKKKLVGEHRIHVNVDAGRGVSIDSTLPRVFGGNRIAINASIARHRAQTLEVLERSLTEDVSTLMKKAKVWKILKNWIDRAIIAWVIADTALATIGYNELKNRLGPLRDYLPAAYKRLFKKQEDFLKANLVLSFVSAIPGWIGMVGLLAIGVAYIASLVELQESRFIQDFASIDAVKLPAVDADTDNAEDDRRLTENRRYASTVESPKYDTIEAMASDLVNRGISAADMAEYAKLLPVGMTALELVAELQRIMNNTQGVARRRTAFRLLMTPWDARPSIAATVPDADGTDILYRSQHDRKSLNDYYAVVPDSLPIPIVCMLLQYANPDDSATDKVGEWATTLLSAIKSSYALNGDTTETAELLRKSLQATHMNIRLSGLFGEGDTFAGRDVCDIAELLECDVSRVAAFGDDVDFGASCAMACYGELAALLLDNHFLTQDGMVYTENVVLSMLDELCTQEPMFKHMLTHELLTTYVTDIGMFNAISVSVIDLVKDVVDLSTSTMVLTWEQLRRLFLETAATNASSRQASGCLVTASAAIPESTDGKTWPAPAAAMAHGFLA